jgi:REP element-mobilizing transposase RayT
MVEYTMKYDPNQRHRTSIRLTGYDYASAGIYFITICTHQRECLFGEVIAGKMHLNQFGTIIRGHWLKLPNHHPHLRLDTFIVMPNHLHGLLVLEEAIAPKGRINLDKTNPQRHGIPEIIRGFKTFSARQVNRMRQSPGLPIWQRSYHDRIVRDDIALENIRQYIQTNPESWMEDSLYS